MKVLILGCATSTGVPIVGCPCRICASTNPKNTRTRTSALIQTSGKNILIDTSTDLRQQALRHKITRIDAVLYTHSHADHTHGIDELRTYNFINKMAIPCFGSPETVRNLQSNFKYIFDGSYSAGGKPLIQLTAVSEEFSVCETRVIPIEINHAHWMIFGYRVGNAAYLTDCSGIPEDSMRKLAGLDILILSALRYNPHPAHFSVEQAIEVVRRLRPKLAVFTHMGHELDYDELSGKLPEGILAAYDGMEFDIPED
ncbi:MAG: MBL fold metallo-hydrolase [Deltaproteobacteria bacterium]